MIRRPTQKLWPVNASRLKVGPLTEPVTADELRDHLRETSAGLSDGQADALITEARAWFEMKTGQALIEQTWTLTLDTWPIGDTAWWSGVKQGSINEMNGAAVVDIALPIGPVLDVPSIKTYDEASTETVVTVQDVFHVDTTSVPARLALKSGQSWPAATRMVNAVVIEYTAGYGADATYVPDLIKRAIKQIAGGLYSHRGDGCESVTDATTRALIGSFMKARI